MRRILRYTVPVDGQAHYFDLNSGPVDFVACRLPGEVEFWHATPASEEQGCSSATRRRCDR